MPRNGSGQYTPPSNSWNPAVDATDIDASDWNDTLDDLADALTGSLAANGETTWTGDQNAGGYKLEGLASGTTSGDALAYQQIGAQVQAYSALLTAVAALTPTDGNFIVGNGTTWVAESGATVRASLGLVIGTDVQAYDADLSAIAALTSAANKLPYATGAQTWALTDFTAEARSFVGQADLSGTTAAEGLVRLADQTAMEAETAGRGVTADVQKYHPAHVKAWVALNMSSSAVRGSYRVASITKNDTGDFTITLSDTFSSTDAMCVMCTGGGDFAEDTNYESVRAFVASTSTIRVYATRQSSGTPVAFDCTRVYVAVLGDI